MTAVVDMMKRIEAAVAPSSKHSEAAIVMATLNH
jgi:hypothetical protein